MPVQPAPRARFHWLFDMEARPRHRNRIYQKFVCVRFPVVYSRKVLYSDRGDFHGGRYVMAGC